MILPYLATALLVLVTAYAAVVSFRPTLTDAASTWLFPNTTSRFLQIAVGLCTVALFAALGVWPAFGTHNYGRRSARFLIPESYVGWVRVEFQSSGAPLVPVEHGEYVFQIPPSGLLKTSSSEQYGWAKDRYLYDSKNGIRRLPDSGRDQSLIWGKLNGQESTSQGSRTYEEFFVGTEQQFKEQIKGPSSVDSSVSAVPSK
jgi:hypothetical protein